MDRPFAAQQAWVVVMWMRSGGRAGLAGK